ncbi:MAG: DUF883 C-terminal domain-containing protein [Burkholderiaceae bacterium]
MQRNPTSLRPARTEQAIEQQTMPTGGLGRPREPLDSEENRWEGEGGSPPDHTAAGPGQSEPSTHSSDRLAHYARQGRYQMRRQAAGLDRIAHREPWKTATVAAFAGALVGALVSTLIMRDHHD